MKKPQVQSLFLYRHRFGIGYTVLALILITALLFLPLLAPDGLSQVEIDAAVTSYYDTPGNVVDLPYHLLQKLAIEIFGLTTYAIKLPSIIIGIVLGCLLTLLLTRWFKNNVALLASVIVILSAPFLYLAGTGTPLIMLVFWPVLLLWAGSRIQGLKKPHPQYCFLFALALLASLFTPYMAYFAVFIVLFVIFNPHLRFTVKTLPKPVLFCTALLTLGGLTFLVINFLQDPQTLQSLLGTEDFTWSALVANLQTGLAPFFWTQSSESLWLSPMLGVATLALALVGLLSTVHGFFASRNALATCLLIATVIFTALNSDAAILLIVPVAILVAHGLRYILERWYGLFPENPYARVFAFFPMAIFVGIVLVSNLTYYIDGYRYNPSVANQYSDDLDLARANLLGENITLVVPADETNLRFYQILSSDTFQVVASADAVTTETFAILGATYTAEETTASADAAIETTDTNTEAETAAETNEEVTADAETSDTETETKTPTLTQIITSSKASDSARIYVYTWN